MDSTVNEAAQWILLIVLSLFIVGIILNISDPQ